MTDREFKVIYPDCGRGVVLLHPPPPNGLILFSAVVISVGCIIRPTSNQYGVKTYPSRVRFVLKRTSDIIYIHTYMLITTSV